jgi:transcriptional regulator with XRE-family HTH domain
MTVKDTKKNGNPKKSTKSTNRAPGFGKRLLELRESQSLGIKELAKKVNVSTVTFYVWESGRSDPGAGNLANIAKVFDLSKRDFYWLVTGI